MGQKYKEGLLFPDFASLYNEQTELSYDKNIRLKVIRGAISPYIIGDYEMEGELYFPKAKAVNITLPPRLISFEESRTSSDTDAGIHHFMYDERICTVWNTPLPFIKRYRHFHCVLGVDFSVFAEEEMIPISIMNMTKSRFLTCAFQKHNITAIPLFTFGHPALERWWYDGIPEYSQVAICNIAIGRNESQKELRQYAIEGLVKRKKPTTLIVFGRELWFDPGVEVKYYEGRLSKFKKMRGEKHEDK